MTYPFLRSSVLFVLALSAGCGNSSQETRQSDSVNEQPTKTVEPLTDEQITEGWVKLFDGESLFGWQANDADADDAVKWEVKDGVIVGSEGGKSLLFTHVPFGDFELQFQYKLETGGNSGVFLRSERNPKDPAVDCYELNFCDTHDEFKTASLVGRVQPSEPVSGDGEWQSVEVRCHGNQITASWNGKQVLSFEDESQNSRASGFIGLQKNAGKIEFKNVSLKPLDLEPLVTGDTLDGWREVPGSQSEFKLQDGMIHVTNGRGYLETEKTWGDFVLQGEVMTHGDALNSGIFFRAMPGTEKDPANGYEYQVQNAYEDDDRTKPADFGTGGIYRRVKARKVVSNDKEWTYLTLVAVGPNIATWVNGEPVVAWTDDRKPDENPRRGLRTEPGHISLQGHDPTTNLDFRNLRIADIAKPEGE
ncbi:3-keto-disaccharide hydrolase [Thalassoroseus pseudoceratinae]|uniref:3-keto-disaccharide hydrolase n=1 Tax=Thalassoroseus pseudoceratinae TaxID=2713176 RepID=UPI00142193C6|nr:DUF1080 domain-containing protein [Thalassoroseus pseudoceratinae]